MFVLKRNQIIITALVIMIVVAGYLNVVDNSETKETSYTLNDAGEIYSTGDANTSFEIGSALTISEDDDPSINTNSVTEPDDSQEPGTAVFVNYAEDSSYFVQAKLNREQARAKEKDVLTEVINNINIEQAQKAQAAESILDIQQRIEKESGAEALIKSKGFVEAYVRMDESSVDVVVNKEALSEAEIAQIQDIVKRVTEMEYDQIHINPMRNN